MSKFFDFLKRTENIFLIIALTFGLIFCFINLPFAASDESSHFIKIYNFTEGSINFQKYTVNNKTYTAAVMPKNLYDIIAYYESVRYDKLKIKSSDITKNLVVKIDKKNLLPVVYIPTSYTICSYLPEFLIFTFFKIFNLPILVIFYALRLISLLFYILLTYFAIKIIPVKKWLLMMCATLPTIIYLAASVSSDGILAGFCFLFTAYVLNLAFNKNIKKIELKHILIFTFLILYITICKYPYSFLVFLFFSIPKEKFENFRLYLKNFILILLLLFVYILANVLYFLFISKGLSHINENIEPFQNMLNILINNPINFFNAVIFDLQHVVPYIMQSVATFGWQEVYLLPRISFIYMVFLAMSAFQNEKDGPYYLDISVKNKLIYLSVFCGFIFITLLTCYLLFSYKGEIGIRNMQGRYLIPVLPLIFLCFSSKNYFKTKIFKYVSIIYILFVYFVSSIVILNNYYII